MKQLAKIGKRFFNSGKDSVIRLMTPFGMRYEDAYAMAHPFDKMVEGILQPEMVEEKAMVMRTAADHRI
ncbi:MAG: hypothetical protein JRG73_20735 [Deltaproteobacteria bacterium]|nr:hypothetical protein [Deltaproteobacteria bacterium]MBW2309354.1 hypothetical protein [Deltaproteobacteria bacterium]